MLFLRTVKAAGAAARTSAFRPSTTTAATTSFTVPRRLAHQDYGSGAHNDKPNPAVDQEHPGPAPPSTSGKGGKSNTSSSSSSSGSSSSKSKSGSQPKILSESPPPESEQSEDVKKHNKDMNQRAERPHEKVNPEDVDKDKVSKGFWKGHGEGVDKKT